VRGECVFAQEGLGCAGRQETLENLAGFLETLATINRAVDDLIRYSGHELDSRELVGEVGLERAGEFFDEHAEVRALLGRRRRTHGRTESLADADPIFIQVVGERSEIARAPAYQPTEDDAAANVLQAPAPLLHGSKNFARFLREHPQGYFFGEECPEDLVRPRNLVCAARRPSFRLLA